MNNIKSKYVYSWEGVTVAAKSNRRQAYEEKRFPPPAIQLLAAFENKRKKDVYKYISSFREKI